MTAITAPTDVQPSTTASIGKPVTYGATIGFGKVVYLDAADNKYKLAANNSTAAIATAIGIAVTPGVDTGGGVIQTTGSAVFTGTTFVVGMTYYLGTAGGCIPEADLATGNYVTRIGTASSSTIIKLSIEATGIVHA
jgi:glucose dehydrogenase